MTKNFLVAFFLVFFFQNTFSQTVVQMEKVNGVYQIPCEVNGIEMKFIFDTGASDISISKTEANFLAKQGLLKENDIVGTQKYQIADGSISEGTKIIISEIKIKDIFINNISATVIDNDNAPLLFGQSALSKFGRFEIEKDILRIYPKENRNNLEFLGIDLTKTIDDFGLSRVNLADAKPVLGIPFDACKVSKEHELKNFKFEKQSVVFDKDGKIFMIGLTKESEGKYSFDKEKYARDFFENLYKTMSAKFGSSESKMAKSAQWKTRNFELIMNIEYDYIVGLFYVPKIFFNQDLVMGNDEPKAIKSNNEYSQELIELRNSITNLINETLKSQSSEFSRKFARINNNDLEFHSEIKIAYQGTKNETLKINKMIGYHFMRQFVSSEEIKAMFIQCDFDNLLFRVQITDKNYDKIVSIQKISKQNLIKLQVPFTETELKMSLE